MAFKYHVVEGKNRNTVLWASPQDTVGRKISNYFWLFAHLFVSLQRKTEKWHAIYI